MIDRGDTKEHYALKELEAGHAVGTPDGEILEAKDAESIITDHNKLVDDYNELLTAFNKLFQLSLLVFDLAEKTDRFNPRINIWDDAKGVIDND